MEGVMSARGSSLVEVIVSAGILATALVTLARLLAIAVEVNVASRHLTSATLLAAQKIEQLRTSPPGEDSSAGGSLEQDIPGYVDRVDAWGGIAGAGKGAAYVRRWSVQPLVSDPAHVSVIHVVVGRPRGTTLADTVTLVTVKARSVP